MSVLSFTTEATMAEVEVLEAELATMKNWTSATIGRKNKIIEEQRRIIDVKDTQLKKMYQANEGLGRRLLELENEKTLLKKEVESQKRTARRWANFGREMQDEARDVREMYEEGVQNLSEK
jgi:hypothetical protein